MAAYADLLMRLQGSTLRRTRAARAEEKIPGPEANLKATVEVNICCLAVAVRASRREVQSSSLSNTTLHKYFALMPPSAWRTQMAMVLLSPAHSH